MDKQNSSSTSYRIDRQKDKPVSRFWGLEGQNTFLGEHGFVFIIFLKQNFLGTRKFVGEQKTFGGAAPDCHPVATGL